MVGSVIVRQKYLILLDCGVHNNADCGYWRVAQQPRP